MLFGITGEKNLQFISIQILNFFFSLVVIQTLLCLCWHVQCIWQCAKSLLFGPVKCPPKQGNPADLTSWTMPNSALVRWKWLLKTTYSKPCSAQGLWSQQGAELPGSVSSSSSCLLKVRPRNPLPSTWGMPRGSNLHELPIAASWPWPQNWLIFIWQYTLISCLPARSHSREMEKQMGHKSKTSHFPKSKSVHRKSLWCVCMSLLHESIEWTALFYRISSVHLLLSPPDHHKQKAGFRSLVSSHQALCSFPALVSLVASSRHW